MEVPTILLGFNEFARCHRTQGNIVFTRLLVSYERIELGSSQERKTHRTRHGRGHRAAVLLGAPLFLNLYTFTNSEVLWTLSFWGFTEA